jgi:glycosyltransferase involved in cell wall biosynthesis
MVSLSDFPTPPPETSGWPWDLVARPPAPETPVPRISIIIPSFRQGRFIEETIRSIVLQQWPNLELIIIDGASTDETVDVIRKYEPWITHWVSEPDRGQTEAIIKGLEKVTGDIVAWFNADDFFVDGIFAAVAAAWRRTPHAIYAAPVVNFYDRGKETLITPRGMSIDNVVQYWKRQALWHDPGLFWSRTVVAKVGVPDPSLHYSHDYDYLLRAMQHAPVEYVECVAAGFRLHQESKTIAHTERMMDETALVSRRYWHLVGDVDRRGYERSEFEARLRRGFSKLLRGKREGLTLLWRSLKERPLTVPMRLFTLVPMVMSERLSRLRPRRYL